MSVVNITNISILNNPAHFREPYQFEITFECLSELQDDLEFRLIYVGSADDTKLDQELDSLLVGPVPVGVNKFVFEADPPDIEKIPKEDLLGVTVVLLTCSYRNKEFVRIGYYVNNEYQEEELKENPPEPPVLAKIYRNILANKPRVTRFLINWENPDEEVEPPKQEEIPEESGDGIISSSLNKVQDESVNGKGKEVGSGRMEGNDVDDEEELGDEEDEEEEEEEEDDNADSEELDSENEIEASAEISKPSTSK